MNRINWPLTAACVVMGALLVFLYSVNFARAHDHSRPELDGWYKSLMQPDNPNVSCCGESDSYFCSEGARGQQVICTINDDRDDKELRRIPVPNGTVIEIPQHKINKDPNLPGRAVVFLSSSGHVWCFVGASGS